MQDGGVGPRADNGVVAGARRAGAEEAGFEFDLQRTLGDTGAEECWNRGIAGGGGGGRSAQHGDFLGVFGAPGVAESVADTGDERDVGRNVGAEGTQVGDRAAAAGGEPGRKIGERETGSLRGPLPNAFALGDGGDKGKPFVVAGIVSNDAVDAVIVGEVGIFGVAEERVGLVAVLRQRNGLAGTDHKDGIPKGQRVRKAVTTRFEVRRHDVRELKMLWRL